jgi:hypothetical protein
MIKNLRASPHERVDSMKCYYQPAKDAVTQCSVCKRPLCDQCALPEENKAFICNQCGARRAAEEATEEMNQRIEQKEIKRQIQEAKRKR